MLNTQFHNPLMLPIRFGRSRDVQTPQTVEALLRMPYEELTQLRFSTYKRLGSEIQRVPLPERLVTSPEGIEYYITDRGVFPRQWLDITFMPHTSVGVQFTDLMPIHPYEFGPYRVELANSISNDPSFIKSQLSSLRKASAPYNRKEEQARLEKELQDLEARIEKQREDAKAVANTHADIVQETGLSKGFDEASLEERADFLRSDQLAAYHAQNFNTDFWLLVKQKDDPKHLVGFLDASVERRNRATREASSKDIPLGHVGDIYLSMIFLRPEARGTGIAHRLILDLLEKYPQESVSLIVSSNNERAIEFYEQIGFEKTGRTGIFPAGDVEMPMTEMLLPKDKLKSAGDICYAKCTYKNRQPKFAAYA